MISMTDAVANIPAGSLGVSGPAETSDAFARDVKKRLARLRIVSRLCSIVGAVLLAAVALLAISATVAPRFMGLQSYTIVSGSMEPSFPVGSLVYAEPIEPEALAVGDVAVFWRNDEVVIHRVEENLYEDCELITRGDANEGIDAHHGAGVAAGKARIGLGRPHGRRLLHNRHRHSLPREAIMQRLRQQIFVILYLKFSFFCL